MKLTAAERKKAIEELLEIIQRLLPALYLEPLAPNEPYVYPDDVARDLAEQARQLMDKLGFERLSPP